MWFRALVPLWMVAPHSIFSLAREPPCVSGAVTDTGAGYFFFFFKFLVSYTQDTESGFLCSPERVPKPLPKVRQIWHRGDDHMAQSGSVQG